MKGKLCFRDLSAIATRYDVLHPFERLDINERFMYSFVFDPLPLEETDVEHVLK